MWRQQLQTEFVLARFRAERNQRLTSFCFRPAFNTLGIAPLSFSPIWLLSGDGRVCPPFTFTVILTPQSDTVWNIMNKERKKERIILVLNFIFPHLLTGQDSENIDWARWYFPQTIRLNRHVCRTVNATSLVVDGSVVRWTIAWPTKSTVYDFTTKFMSFPSTKLIFVNVYEYLIFDRCKDFSLNGNARLCGPQNGYQCTSSCSKCGPRG